MLGIDPANLNPYNFFEATHPDDKVRHGLGRSLLFKSVDHVFSAKQGWMLLSTNLRMQKPSGGFTNLLLQCYLFYSRIPYDTIFLLEIHTDIDWYKTRKHGFHYYLGDDLSKFKCPDEELLNVGIPYSDRESEIIRFVALGLSSQQIAERTSLSIHTINTHRKNILLKSEKKNMHEIIRDLLNQGVI